MKPLEWFPWNGSKRRLLPFIKALTEGQSFQRYLEPFVGGGSVSHFIRQQHPDVPQRVSDKNPWLMAAYERQVAGEPVPVPDDYLDTERWRQVRDEDASGMTSAEKLQRFGICVLTAWGNRWKTEADGRFTPSSTPINPKFCDPTKLHTQLERVFTTRWLDERDEARSCHWLDAVADAREGDLIYLDPPYPELLGYGSQVWTLSDMLDLIDWIADVAVPQKVWVVSSNVAHLERLYRRAGLRTEIVTLGGASNTRKARQEVLATSLPQVVPPWELLS